jgi:intracellular septation protein A
MSIENNDRDKVVNALGGKKGLIDSGLPSVLFLIVFNIADNLRTALYAAVITSALLTILRLIKKDTIQHVISGFIGVVFCAYLANRTGNATDFFLPKFLTNLVYGTVYLIGNVAGWPILGLVLGPILGENLLWRKNPERKKAYIRAGWLWVAMFYLRLLVQVPIYLSGPENLNLLGSVNLAMGYPLFAAAAWGSWLIIKKVPSVKPED